MPGTTKDMWAHLRDLHPLEGAALLLSVGFRVPRETIASALGVPQHHIGRLCDRGLWTLRARAGADRARRRQARPAGPSRYAIRERESEGGHNGNE